MAEDGIDGDRHDSSASDPRDVALVLAAELGVRSSYRSLSVNQGTGLGLSPRMHRRIYKWLSTPLLCQSDPGAPWIPSPPWPWTLADTADQEAHQNLHSVSTTDTTDTIESSSSPKPAGPETTHTRSVSTTDTTHGRVL